MPISVQPRQGTENIFSPLTLPAANTSQGIASAHNSLNSMRENAPTGASSCNWICLTWIRNAFSWLSLKFFGRTVTSEELIQKAEEIRGSHGIFLSNHETFPSKIIITIQLNDTFVAVVKEDLHNQLDAAQFRQRYETTLRQTLQGQELSGDATLTLTAYQYNRIALTPEQIQARGRSEPFVYNLFRSKNIYDFRSVLEREHRQQISELYNQYNPHLLLHNDMNHPQFRTEIQEFLVQPINP